MVLLVVKFPSRPITCPKPTHKSPLICFVCVCSVEGDGPGSEVGTSVDSSSCYGYVPVTHRGGLGPERLDNQLYGQILLPGHPRPRRSKLQHSQSILRKQVEEEAIKRSRSLSESYELSSDLQDKQVTMTILSLCLYIHCQISWCLGDNFKVYVQIEFLFFTHYFSKSRRVTLIQTSFNNCFCYQRHCLTWTQVFLNKSNLIEYYHSSNFLLFNFSVTVKKT